MRPYVIILSLALLAWGCKQEAFQQGRATDQHFHLKIGEHFTPIWVRGNTSSGKILLYIQGGPGGNSMDFAAMDYAGWKDGLETEVAVAYYDQLGTGNRQGNFDLEDINLDRYVAELHAVSAFLAETYQAEVVLMGHSFGGNLVYRYMMEKKEEAIPSKFISINGPASNDRDSLRWVFRRDFLYNTALLEMDKGNNTERWMEVLEWLEDRPVIKNVEGDNPWADKDQWNAYVEELVYEYYQEKDISAGEIWRVLFDSPYNLFPAYLKGGATNEMLRQLFDEINSNSIIDRLGEISQPILLLTGRYDDICPPAEMNFILENLSSENKQLDILEEAGHESFVHQSDAFLQSVLSFIQ